MDTNQSAAKRSLPKRAIVGPLLVFSAIVVGVSFVAVEPGERVAFVAFMFLLIAVGVANAFIPGVKAVTTRVIGTYLWFSGLLLVSLGPLVLFRLLAEALLDSAAFPVRVLVLTTWGVLLATAAFVVIYGRTRDALFNALQRIGMLIPVAYSVNLLFVSVQFFATVTFMLHDAGRATLKLGGATVVSVGTVSDFFLWHFLNAVPVLKITDTLMWNPPPLTYDPGAVGWIVLAFKISVIIPVIAAFGWSWGRFKKGGPKNVAISASRVQR